MSEKSPLHPTYSILPSFISFLAISSSPSCHEFDAVSVPTTLWLLVGFIRRGMVDSEGEIQIFAPAVPILHICILAMAVSPLQGQRCCRLSCHNHSISHSLLWVQLPLPSPHSSPALTVQFLTGPLLSRLHSCICSQVSCQPISKLGSRSDPN